MIFTRRLFLLLALGLLPLLLAYVVPGLAALTTIWNLILLALCIADYVTCLNPTKDLVATRSVPSSLSVSAPSRVHLRLVNRSSRTMTLQLRDERPYLFAAEVGEPAPEWQLKLTAGEVMPLEYRVTPQRRGNYAFGDMYARITGPLGLIVRQGVIPATASVSVYPNLRAVEDYELMLRRAHLTRQGTRRVRIAGGGREFSALREYTPDDEYRVIDWKATARRNKIISRTFEAERSQDVLILIDQGRLMRQEIGQTEKLDFVVNAALMLSHVVAEADDRVGMLIFADQPRSFLPPRRGRAQANEILEALYAAKAEPVESDYRAAFRFLASHWRKRSLAVLFTDLSDSESSAMLLREIAQLAATHLVVCVVVSDPLIARRAKQAAENVNQVYEKAVAEDVITDRRRALDLLQARGVLIVDAEPQQLSVELVARYLEVKSRAML